MVIVNVWEKPWIVIGMTSDQACVPRRVAHNNCNSG